MDEVEVGGLRIAGLHGAHLRVASPGRSPTVRIRRDVLAAAGLDEVGAVGLEVEGAIALEGQRSRSGAPAAEPVPLIVTVPPPPSGRGQLLLVEDAGAVRWVVPDTAGAGSRPAEPAASTFTAHIDANGTVTTRGPLGPAARRVLRLLTFALDDPIAGRVGDEFVRRWEEHHRPYRLRSFRPDDYRLAGGDALDRAGIRALGDGPALLLIHGTNALTHTGFGGLPYDEVRRLHERYGGRVVAFDHPSLSVDPAENARRLLAMIPADAELELDILAHSRGGLVARMLTERPSDLGAELSRVRVRQVVFVATPNDGTPLADPRHLGSLVDALTNLLDTVPDDPSSVATLAGVVSVVKQLAVGALGGLGGLVAMQPSAAGGFLAGLNRPRPVSARYRAVSADYEPTAGSGISRVAINAIIDRLFAHESNDLIVPTRSVYRWNGASAFPIAERVVLPAERGVDHSSFWMSGEVTKALDTWLVPDPLTPPGQQPMVHGPLSGDEPDPLADVDERLAAGDIDGVRAAIRALPERHRRDLEQEVGGLLVEQFARGAAAPKSGKVFVLHGIMGSLLAAQDADADLDRIWISPLRLLGGGFARLRHPAGRPIRAVGLHRTYLPLLIGLDADFDVEPFAYDWRLGLDAAAEELAARIHGPAHLVAHSMGGLVCRMLRARHRAVWDRLVDGDNLAAGGRLVMLGTPTLGSLSIVTALTAEDKLVRWLARIDVRNGTDDIQRIIASFPGVYQLLPSDDPGAPLYDVTAWRDGQVDRKLLAQARDVGEQLAADGFDSERMLYIAGSGHKTAAGVQVDGRGRFRFRVTHLGDGRVTHDAGLARRAGTAAITKVWYSVADHGGLAKDATVVAAVTDLLRRGTTERLPTQPPAKTRAMEPVPEYVTGEQLEPPPFIDGDLLTRSSRGVGLSDKDRVRIARDFMVEATRSWLGSTPLDPAPRPALSVHVLHASLEHASYPVVVGHYAGTPIGGAEAWVDEILRGRLSARQLLGRYPSHPSDVYRSAFIGQIVLGPFAGAIVVGLGEMGELTPTKLTMAMRNAALEWALASAVPTSLAPVDDDATAVAVKLSSVLLGSYGPDALQMATVVSALVEGVMLANRELSEVYTGRPVRIDELEFVEVYGHRAEEAGRIVRDLDRYLPEVVRSGSTLRCADRIRIGEGGRSAAPSAEYATGMWRRLIVSRANPDDDDDGRIALTYTSLGVRARAELLSHVVDNRLLGRMVRDAVGSAQVDGSVNVALFELLLPNDLKRELASVENLVLVVDEHTAAIPWEALADRNAVAGVEPLVKRTGLVRQLQLDERRDGPMASLKPRALIIGDPPVGPGFPRLEGARREAATVAAQLDAAGLDVDATMVFGPDAPYEPGTAGAILGRLLADDYQIVHIAAHGWYEEAGTRPGAEPWGGVVIGPEQYLTAVEINQMRRPPDLVFLNCCHLAAVDSEVIGRPGSIQAGRPANELAIQRVKRPQLAASLSRTLMKMGVRAVVAAGWAVDDRAASEFAKAFYERMLDGESFGPAVRAARIVAHQSDGGASNTWAAYQCYGDPGFRISSSPRRRPTLPTPVSAQELVRAAEALAVKAGDAGIDIDEVREELSRLERIAAENWSDNGDISAALGRASSACLDLAAAVRHYRRALTAAAGDVPIKVIEQLANLEMRLAGEIGDGEVGLDDEEAWTAAKLLDSARRRVDIIGALPATPERQAISASVWKAVAVRTTGAERQAALEQAARNYFQRWATDGQPYGANNALQLDGTGGLLTDEQRAELMAAIDAPDFVKPGADFWARIAEADLLLTRSLADGSITDDACSDRLYELYGRIFDERSTPLERSSAVRHTRELAALVRDEFVQDALARLSKRLAGWTRS